MKNILLVLPSSGGAGRAIAHAVGTAKKESATLFALYVLETEVTEDALERLTDMGFIGERPSTELSEAITKEKRQRGYESLGKAVNRAFRGNNKRKEAEGLRIARAGADKGHGGGCGIRAFDGTGREVFKNTGGHRGARR